MSSKHIWTCTICQWSVQNQPGAYVSPTPSMRTELIPFEVGSLHSLATPALRQLGTIPRSPRQVSNKHTTPRAPVNTKGTTAPLKGKLPRNIDSGIALALEGARVAALPRRLVFRHPTMCICTRQSRESIQPLSVYLVFPPFLSIPGGEARRSVCESRTTAIWGQNESFTTRGMGTIDYGQSGRPRAQASTALGC
jgi:hypothetical protein